MAESGRITQLQMMLVQQAGPSVLPLSILALENVLPFIRATEELALQEKLSPVLVYWSRHTAARFLPSGARYRQLMREALYVSIFSEDTNDPPEEWSFLLESRSLSLVVYGQQTLEALDSKKYQCSGSMDPQIVRQAFNRLLPIWQFFEPAEANRVEDARVNIGYSISAPQLVQQLKAAWPVVKSPIGQSLIIPVAPTLMPDQGKVQPIDLMSQSITDAEPLPELVAPQFGANVPSLAAVNPEPDAPKTSAEAPNQKEIWPDFAKLQSNNDPPAAPATGDPNELGKAPVDASTLLDRGSGGSRPPRNRRKAPFGEGDANSGDANANDRSHIAQAIITDIIGRLRHSSDLGSILQFAIENLTKAAKADRGVIWQIVGDQLIATTEYAAEGHTCFAGNQLGATESQAILLEFLSRFPDESGAGVIPVSDTSQDTNLHKVSRTLSSLIELGEVKGRLMVQLRSHGIFYGFLELQQCSSTRQWSRDDAMMLQSVAEMLSVVVQQSFDQSRIEMDAREMKLINDIASLFRDSRGQSSQESLAKSVLLVSEHMGFVHSQIYLYNSDERTLVPQIQNGSESFVDLSSADNPFASVFDSGHCKVINMEYSRKGDPFFGHDTALVLPLVAEGERLGVFGLWQRQSYKAQFRPQDRDLGLTIAGHLSNVIRAEQAVLHIRAEQARAALINKVSSEIRQSLKEVDQITKTLVESLREHFNLAYCVASLYDPQTKSFSKSKVALANDLTNPSNGTGSEEQTEQTTAKFGEELFMSALEELQNGDTVFLSGLDIAVRLAERGVMMPRHCKSATLVPLVQAGNLEAALCMISSIKDSPLPMADMNMVADLADRVAVVVSRAELFAQIERQAVTDPMTGLFNRRYFQEQLSKEIDRFQRFGHPFSYLMVDLDFLKKINDSLGHQYGDVAIKHIANIVKRNVRDVDTVGRWGGEEFVVLLPETDMIAGKIVAERICGAIREKPVEGIGTITASLGLATFPQDTQERAKLFDLADKALFQAKFRGRNQVCTAAEDVLPALTESGDMKIDLHSKFTQPKLAEISGGLIDLNFISKNGLLGVLTEISRKIDERDAYPQERSTRAFDYANKIGKALHWSKDHAELIALAATLNNLGKIEIPDQILQKPGPLTDEEMELVRRSPDSAAKLLEPARLLQKIAPIVEAYHEHWDGTGYPRGLKGNDIPMEARVVSLIDAFVAMTSDRPYRKGLTAQQAIKELQKGAGKKWDPRIVKVFLALLRHETDGNGTEPSSAN
jgi:diguanylate cyclase (GGDEF)-like protein